MPFLPTGLTTLSSGSLIPDLTVWSCERSTNRGRKKESRHFHMYLTYVHTLFTHVFRGSSGTRAMLSEQTVRGTTEKGKWTHEIVCVDLNEELLDFIRVNYEKKITCTFTAGATNPHMNLRAGAPFFRTNSKQWNGQRLQM